jgi:hypothetical protein
MPLALPALPRRRIHAAILLLGLSLATIGCSGDDPAATTPDEPCSVTVSTPLAGALFTSGEVVNIRWRAEGGADRVRVGLMRGGAEVGALAEATDNDGYMPWFADGSMGGSGDDYVVEVTALGEGGCSGRSEPFTIHDTEGCAYVFSEFETPLNAGETTLLTWETTNGTGAVDIGLYRWTGLIGDVAVNLPDVGSYAWTVDSFNHGTDDHFWFEIRDHDLPGCVGVSRHVDIIDEDVCSVFVASPADGVVWSNGETRDIVFDQDNGGGRVNIILQAGQTFLGYIATDYDMSLGPYAWVVEDFDFDGPDDMYRVEVVDTVDEYCRAESRIFTILR